MANLTAEDRRVWLLIGVMAALSVLFVPFSQAAFGVTYSYTLRTVALGGALLGIVSGVLGCFAVLRHESLMGDALSHAALPGVAVAFLIAGRELGVLLIGAGIASWLGVQFIAAVLRTTRIKQDAAMGIVLAAWFAVGVALLAYIQNVPDASQAGLETFIFGQAAALVTDDLWLIAGVGAVAFGVLVVLWKEFKLVTFDPDFAGANGFRLDLLNGLLSTLIVVAVVLGLQLAGVILMVGMLIAPGIAARQWTHRLNQMVILAAVFGAFAGGTGAILSAIDTDTPTGPMIIVVSFAVVGLSLAFAPGRGLVWSLLQQRADRRRFAAQRALRDLYRYAQSHGSDTHPVPAAFMHGVGDTTVKLGLKQLEQHGDVANEGDRWRLTERGVARAGAETHNRQLWDAYRKYGDELDIPIVAEDRQRDIHRALTDDDVEKLEHKLEQSKGTPR